MRRTLVALMLLTLLAGLVVDAGAQADRKSVV